MSRTALLAALASVFLLASCADTEYGDAKLDTGLYSAQVEVGTLCVDIFNKGKCDIYLAGGDVFHGSYEIDGRDLYIKGYASLPDDVTEGWQSIYTLTAAAGGIGSVEDKTTFTYRVHVQRPLRDAKDIWYTFKKQ